MFSWSLTTCKKLTWSLNTFLRYSWLTLCHHFGHVQTCLTTPTSSKQLIFVAFMDLSTSHNSTSYLNLIVRYYSLKDLALWLVLRFLNYNSRTRFFPKHLVFEKKLKIMGIFVFKQKSISEWIGFLQKF